MTISDLAHDPEPVLGDAYEVVRELGRGGMAVVYLARERATGRERAIKVIHSRFLGDAEAVARFAREAKLVSTLVHPNIVPIAAVERLDGGGLALVMDRVPGRTLKQILRDDGPLPVEMAERVMDDIALALAHAHAHGIVHRDVKPENIFVDETTGHALLSDFGIARSMETETQLTMAGVAIGTPTYMAPEQIEGAALDGRSDLYSLGLVAWEMLTGKRPWDGETLYNVIYRQKHDYLPPVDTLRLDAPPRLLAAIEGLLEKSPSERWASAADLRAALHSTAPLPRRMHTTADEHGPYTSTDTIALDRSAFTDAASAGAPSPVAEGRQRSALSRFGPVAVAAALLISATLLFARPEPNTEAPTASAGNVGTAALRDVGARPVPVRSSAAPPSSGTPPADGGSATGGSGTGSTMAGAGVTSPEGGDAARLDSDAARAASAAPTGARAPAAPAPAAPAAPAVKVPRVVTESSPRVALTLPAPARDPAPTPAVAAPVRGVTGDAESGRHLSVAVGAAHTCLLSSDGATYCWGGNAEGQLGSDVAGASIAPVAVGGSTRFAHIASGATHTCALTSAGVAYCWGANDDGELGDGTTTERSAPTRVSGGHPYVAIVAGLSHSCALAADGRVACWGAGNHGQLGNGATSDRATPVSVAGATRFSDIASGWNHTCALTETGIAYCWGANSTGSLGDGTTTDRIAPTPVRTSVRFIALSAGSGHTCGIATTGAAYCWGQNRFGQLGDGTATSRLTPTPVSGDQRFASISAGGVSTCALTRDHQAWCWGRNAYGQLGDGSSADRARPVRVAGDHSFATISTFGAHTCATTTTDELFCWGYNLDGQLGDGSRDHRNRPVYVERPAG